MATLALAAAIVTALPAGLAPARADEPYLVVVNDAPPFRIIENWGGDSGYAGAYIDTIFEIQRRTGIPLEFRHVPFARALAMMENGAADIMLGPNWSVERAAYMVYLDASFPAETKVFFAPDGGSDVESYQDLKSLRVGVLRAARYFEPFDSDDTIQKITFDTYRSAFVAARQGRVDVVIIPERQGKYLLRQFGWSFTASSFRVPGTPSFITISRKSNLIKKKAKIEDVMEQLNQEGFFARLLVTYLE
ncbi:transporter substrate-binding domain-containing protein [Breoghania sp. L-A4]|uniref:substrate-binding periplasmic protein n=1 Tax=Breoghania sp. L-A4 TaxID=2304600 RepID=UPI0013C32216|nr:transporter substrate-binding domain-containing protein [Breoghania sp. L-A4]